MDDLIRRQDAIDAVKTDWNYSNDQIRAINRIPSVQQWIPCSERLPEDYTEVLASTKDYVYFANLCTYIDGTHSWEESAEHWTIKDVIAWMPLPEPWEGEK